MTGTTPETDAKSSGNEHIDVDVPEIKRIHCGYRAERPHPDQAKNEAWIGAASGIVDVSNGEIWVEHPELTELVRCIR